MLTFLWGKSIEKWDEPLKLGKEGGFGVLQCSFQPSSACPVLVFRSPRELQVQRPDSEVMGTVDSRRRGKVDVQGNIPVARENVEANVV